MILMDEVAIELALLRVLQGEPGILYATKDDTTLVKFDRVEIDVATNGTTNILFKRGDDIVAKVPSLSPISPGQILHLQIRGGLEARLTI